MSAWLKENDPGGALYGSPDNTSGAETTASVDDQVAMERAWLADYLDYPEDAFVFLRQEHGSKLAGPHPEHLSTADAAWCRGDRILVIRTADCLGLLGWNQEQNIQVAIHAGWRGLEGRIITESLVRIHTEVGGSTPLETWLGGFDFILGPHRRRNRYEVGPEFRDIFDAKLLREHEDKLFFSIEKAAMTELESLGVPRRRIKDKGWCTGRDKKLFFSHRHGDRGRNLNFIYNAAVV
jgi:copper oxidase (laccase) domain-containing protein